MPASPVIDDLFGHVPQDTAPGRPPVDDDGANDSEDAEGEDCFAEYVVPYAQVPEGGHTPDSIRAHVVKVMAVVRQARVMPFGARELRTYTAMMPYLCEWLTGGEGEALLAEFRGHIERLEAAA